MVVGDWIVSLRSLMIAARGTGLSWWRGARASCGAGGARLRDSSSNGGGDKQDSTDAGERHPDQGDQIADYRDPRFVDSQDESTEPGGEWAAGGREHQSCGDADHDGDAEGHCTIVLSRSCFAFSDTDPVMAPGRGFGAGVRGAAVGSCGRDRGVAPA